MTNRAFRVSQDRGKIGDEILRGQHPSMMPLSLLNLGNMGEHLDFTTRWREGSHEACEGSRC